MQNPWWLAIIIGLSSGALGAIVTYAFNYKKERSQYLRQKAEDLYMAVHHFERWISADVIVDLSGQRGKMTSVEDSTEVAAAAQSYRNVTAISEVYFPHLVPLVHTVLDARDKLHTAKIENRTQTDRATYAGQFSDAMKTLKTKVAAQCRRPMTGVTYMNLVDLPWN